MKIFSIAGWSGSGKTLLITRLIKSFKVRQRRVIAVKNAPEAYALQPEAKDTAQFLRAGADEVFLVAQKELLRMTPLNDPRELLQDLEARLQADDIVLLEGLYQTGIPVIEIKDPKGEKTLKFPQAELVALVSNEKCAPGLPCFHPDQIVEITAFMEGYHEKHH
ncbi:MAG: molybdopterin-guanine dinucleotide biosynthesis protein B [Candidatus Aminicenantes bacterium]|nr:molybdopterin-guanine dinucleotide biosynthesis protein B [Candidatus Aminicenantes bacterium]